VKKVLFMVQEMHFREYRVRDMLGQEDLLGLQMEMVLEVEQEELLVGAVVEMVLLVLTEDNNLQINVV